MLPSTGCSKSRRTRSGTSDSRVPDNDEGMTPIPPSEADERMTPFPLSEARALVRDLREPNARIYWADFLFHIVLGWGAFVFTLASPTLSLQQGVAFVVCALALYRTAIFTHELAHLRKGALRGLRTTWNILCGFPFLVPHFTYRGVHNDHHVRDVYGTGEDGEYVPFATLPPYRMVLYVLLSFVLPLLLVVRFVVLVPLAYLSPKLRRLVWERASSLTIDVNYRRPISTKKEWSWKVQEAVTFAYAAGAILLVALDVLPVAVLVLWYAVEAFILFVNSLRTLAAHAYRNPSDRHLDVPGQFLDSVNVPGNRFLTPLWAPVGLRYHATHHLFPALPYHALGKAHRRLVRDLPDNSSYLETSRSSLWDALRRLWREADLASQDRSAPQGAPTHD